MHRNHRRRVRRRCAASRGSSRWARPPRPSSSPIRGVVIDGGRGTAEELQLTDEEAARAFSASTGLTVGRRPARARAGRRPTSTWRRSWAPLTTTVERHGARVVSRATAVATGAATCASTGSSTTRPPAVVIIGSQGDLTAPTERAVAQDLTVPVSIGDTVVAPGSVVIDSDPITRAFEQGRAGGAPLGVPEAPVQGAAPSSRAPSSRAAVDPARTRHAGPQGDRAAGEGPGHASGRRSSRPRPTSRRRSAQLPPSGILIGEGVRLTQATAEGLDTLPAGPACRGGSCTP